MLRSCGKASDKVPTDIVEHSADKQVRKLGDNKARNKETLVVYLALLLSYLKDVAAVDKERLQLANNTQGNEDKVKDGKEILLQIYQRVADYKKR